LYHASLLDVFEYLQKEDMFASIIIFFLTSFLLLEKISNQKIEGTDKITRPILYKEIKLKLKKKHYCFTCF